MTRERVKSPDSSAENPSGGTEAGGTGFDGHSLATTQDAMRVSELQRSSMIVESLGKAGALL